MKEVPDTRRNWLNSLEGIKWEQVEILAEYDALNQGVSDSLDPFEAFRPFGVVRTIQDVKKGLDWMKRLSDVKVGERQLFQPGSPAIGCEGQRCRIHEIDWGE